MIAPGGVRPLAAREARRAGALLKNHADSLLLVRTAAGTLRLSVDEVGLLMDVDLPDTQVARGLAVSIERGDIRPVLVRIHNRAGRRRVDLDSVPAAQTASEVARLYDVSVVSYPAYPQTEVALRSLQEARARQQPVPPRPPLERFAREARWNELAE